MESSGFVPREQPVVVVDLGALRLVVVADVAAASTGFPRNSALLRVSYFGVLVDIQAMKDMIDL